MMSFVLIFFFKSSSTFLKQQTSNSLEGEESSVFKDKKTAYLKGHIRKEEFFIFNVIISQRPVSCRKKECEVSVCSRCLTVSFSLGLQPLSLGESVLLGSWCFLLCCILFIFLFTHLMNKTRLSGIFK